MVHFDADRLSREYNNRALVANSAELIAGWSVRSAAVRERATGQLNLAYAQGERCVLDVFTPRGRRNCPVLFFIPGGWYRALSKDDYSFVVEAYLARGIVCVVPSYALAPSVSVTQIFEQMQCALAWTQTHIARFDGDAARITLAGHSAGGHLAALLACTSADRFHALLVVSGLLELESVRHTPFLQTDLGLGAEEAKALSPARYAPPKTSMHVALGADESRAFHEQAELALRAWGKYCVQSTTSVAQANHFTVMDAFSEPGSALHQRFAAAIQASSMA